MAELKRIAICDDEIGTCSDLEKIVLDFANRRALRIETEVFYSGESFYRSIQEQCLYDLVFLDIQLLELDGVQVGRRIREQLGNEKISIVYISSKETYAMSLFQVRPLDFLIKPLTKEKVAAVLMILSRQPDSGYPLSVFCCFLLLLQASYCFRNWCSTMRKQGNVPYWKTRCNRQHLYLCLKLNKLIKDKQSE